MLISFLFKYDTMVFLHICYLGTIQTGIKDFDQTYFK